MIKVLFLCVLGTASSRQPSAEFLSPLPTENHIFISHNFTDAEIAYCHPQTSDGANAAVKEIEILPNETGIPEVMLHGNAKAAAASEGISTIHLSLSQSDVSFHFSLTGRIVLNPVSQTVPFAFAQAPSHGGFAHLLTSFAILYRM